VDMRISKATAVVVQRVADKDVPWFVEWQRGVNQASEAFPGYRGTDVYPPPGGLGGDWVAVVDFEDEHSLRAWLDSPVRRAWVERLKSRVGAFDLKVSPGGFGAWFAGCAGGQDVPIPGWKIVLVVLLGLYPTVMCLALFPGPSLQPLGLAVSMLVGNALSVSILQWAVMPALNLAAGPWLKANGPGRRIASLAGLGVALALLAGLALLFRQVTG